MTELIPFSNIKEYTIFSTYILEEKRVCKLIKLPLEITAKGYYNCIIYTSPVCIPYFLEDSQLITKEDTL